MAYSQAMLDSNMGKLFLYRPRGRYAFPIFMVTLVLLQGQLVPRWERWSLGIPPLAIMAILAIVGGTAGYLGARLQRAGLVTGALTAMGGAAANWFVLENWPGRSVYFVVMALVMLAGMYPGMLIYREVDKRNPEKKDSVWPSRYAP